MMTLNEYMRWDGTFTAEEREEAYRAERAMLKTLTAEEKDEYFDLTEAHVYASVDYGKAEEKKTAKALYNFCKAHNFTIEQAMIAY